MSKALSMSSTRPLGAGAETCSTGWEARHRRTGGGPPTRSGSAPTEWPGPALGRAERWTQAKVLFDEALHARPFDSAVWEMRILAMIATGARDSSRKVASEMLELFRGTTDPVTANNIAWFCTLAPGAVAEPEIPVETRRACRGRLHCRLKASRPEHARLCTLPRQGGSMRRSDGSRKESKQETGRKNPSCGLSSPWPTTAWGTTTRLAAGSTGSVATAKHRSRAILGGIGNPSPPKRGRIRDPLRPGLPGRSVCASSKVAKTRSATPAVSRRGG